MSKTLTLKAPPRSIPTPTMPERWSSQRGKRVVTVVPTAGRRSAGRKPAAQPWDCPFLDAAVRRWPQAFVPRGVVPRPLACGIDREILAEREALAAELGISVGRLRVLLWTGMRRYTGAPWYLKALKPNAPRVDLQGNRTGAVTPDEAASARARLADKRAGKRAPRMDTQGGDRLPRAKTGA